MSVKNILPTTARKICEDVKRNPQATSTKKASLKNSSVAVSRPTIKKYMNKNGLHGRVVSQKALATLKVA